MPATTIIAPSATLLGRPESAALALRIHGTDRHGQIVRLQSPKVAIGSSHGCTLRLRAPGIAPWHCLILRGASKTVVRRWHCDTRLNDAAFDDAPLHTGDRLTIGPIEFEVLDDRTLSAEAKAESAPAASNLESIAQDEKVCRLEERLSLANRQARDRLRSILRQLRTARSETIELRQLTDLSRQSAQRFENGRTQLEIDRLALEEERARCRDMRAQDEQFLLEGRNALDEQSRRVSAEAMELAGQREALEIARQSLLDRESKLDDRLAEFDARDNTKLASHQKQEQSLQQRATELEAREARLNEQEAAIARRQSELESQKPEIETAAKTEADQQVENLTAQLNSTQQAFDADHAAWELERRGWETERQTWQSDKTAWETQRQALIGQTEAANNERADREKVSAQRLAELDGRQAEIEQAQATLTELQAALAEQQKALTNQQQELEVEKMSLAGRRSNWEGEVRQQTTAIERLKTDLTAERERWALEIKTREATLANLNELLDRRTTELETEIQSVTGDREKLQAERERFKQQLAATKERAVIDSAAEPIHDESANVASDRPTERTSGRSDQADAAPASAGDTDEDVFARLRALSLLKTDSGEAQSERPVVETVEEPTIKIVTESAEKKAEPRAAAAENEESIDDYMARLLKQYGHQKSESTSQQPNGKTAKGQAAAQPPAVLPVEEPTPQPKAPQKLEPRNLAPEKTHILAAMREIANHSARSAIAMHQHRRGASRAWGSLGVATVALAGGLWLVLTAEEAGSPCFWGGVAGIIVALYWFVKSGLFARRAKHFNRHQQQLAAISSEIAAKENATVEESQPQPTAE
jgi:hypothetical protein